ncbi:MAG: hypothetical protein F6K42_05105 [Leptolyngbya sp. SIO1D8]|nr:hypothetical protein [Leptolyngbya sp. SIO1D8]
MGSDSVGLFQFLTLDQAAILEEVYLTYSQMGAQPKLSLETLALGYLKKRKQSALIQAETALST